MTQRLSSSAAQRIGEILSTEAQNAAPLAQKSYPAGAAVDWQPLAGPSSSSKTEVQQKDMKNSSVDGSPQTTVTPAHIDDAVLDPLAWFDANIQMLAHARQFCADLQRRYEIERTRREELEGQTHANSEMEAALSAAHTQVQNLHTKLE